MLFWDLDGVLRDISTAAYGYHIPQWDYKGEDGKGLIQRVNDNISLLVKAPPTEYKDMVERAYEVMDVELHILTVQPKRWQSYTHLWVLNQFQKIGCKITFFQSARDKYAYFKEQEPNSAIVEDHPCFPSYERVILIRRPWNSSVNNALKIIHDVDEMQAFIVGEVL